MGRFVVCIIVIIIIIIIIIISIIVVIIISIIVVIIIISIIVIIIVLTMFILSDVIMKRSTDGGATWSNITIVHANSSVYENNTIGSPTPVQDRDTHVVLLPFTRNDVEVRACAGFRID